MFAGFTPQIQITQQTNPPGQQQALNEFPQQLAESEKQFFRSLGWITDHRTNKRPNDRQATLLVGLSIIRERIDHDTRALDTMENIVTKDIPQRTKVISDNVEGRLANMVNNLRVRNVHFFERVTKLERRVTELAQRNDKLERRQKDLELLHNQTMVQQRLVDDIDRKMKRVSGLKDDFDFYVQQRLRGSPASPVNSFHDQAEDEQKQDVLILLQKLKESMLKLADDASTTERMAEDAKHFAGGPAFGQGSVVSGGL